MVQSFRGTYRSFRTTLACFHRLPSGSHDPQARAGEGSGLSISEQPIDFEVEHSRRIEPENPRALVFVEAAHLPLDCLGGMGPRAFVMGIVIGPQEIVHQ